MSEHGVIVASTYVQGSKLEIAGFPTKVYNGNLIPKKYDDYSEWTDFLDKPKSKLDEQDMEKLKVLYYIISTYLFIINQMINILDLSVFCKTFNIFKMVFVVY